MNIDRDVSIDPLQHVVALVERPPGNGTGTHGDHVFRRGYYLKSRTTCGAIFLVTVPGNNHEISLTRRRSENRLSAQGQRDMEVAIISMAQQARPKLERPQELPGCLSCRDR